MLSQYELIELLSYNKSTGLFSWVCSGKKAGNISPHGYLTININGTNYFAHRLAYLYMLGRFPYGVIDHINGVRADNRAKNIRDVTSSINAKNTKLKKGNTTGLSGVTYKNKGWYVTLGSKGVLYKLGAHADFFEACCTRKSAEIGLGFHENHGR